MTIKEQMDDTPVAVVYEPAGNWTTVLIRTNIEEHTEGEGEEARTYYTDDLLRVVMPTADLTKTMKAKIEKDPAGYVRKLEVDDEKPAVEELIQSWINRFIAERTTIPCDGFPKGIIYDSQACLNALGLEIGDPFVDAGNDMHVIDSEETIQTIRTAVKRYGLSVYGKATAWRTRLAHLETKEELEALREEVKEALEA